MVSGLVGNQHPARGYESGGSMTDKNDSDTRGERRERRRRSRRTMGVSGRSVRTLQDIIRRRAQQRSTGRKRGRAAR